MKTNGSEHAYPHLHLENGTVKLEGGLTKREHFVALAMQGLLQATMQGCPECKPKLTSESTFDDIAYLAVQAAKDLINELNKETK